MFNRLSRRIRRSLGVRARDGLSGQVAGTTHLASYLTGWFDYSEGSITGWVENTLEPWDRNLTVAVVRGRDIIAGNRVHEKSATVGWRFAIETGSQVSTSDILSERVHVVVWTPTGDTQRLRLEGSTQLELIREQFSDPVMPFLEIDFRESGNSSGFAIEGWSVQEKIHRWTEGTQSTLAFDSPPHDRGHTLQLLLWPFIVPGRLAEQRLQVLIDETEIAHLGISRQSFLRFAMPLRPSPDPMRMIVRFIHPDAASPASLGISDDPRLLAFAFKKATIVPAVGGDAVSHST
jgi:hypothetical protein